MAGNESILSTAEFSVYQHAPGKNRGVYIQHGFSTIIAAKQIGEYCWINQQVTIGFTEKGNPIIGDHCRICAGAIVNGDVHIADSTIVGAGAVVVNDTQKNTIVAGVPARAIKMDH